MGELLGGGVIFYADQTGQHGLICSMESTSDFHNGGLGHVGKENFLAVLAVRNF